MKRFLPLIVLCLVTALVIMPVAWAASARPAAAPTPASGERAPGNVLARSVSTITGIAISPLLGTGALGFYQWWTAKDAAARAALPWYAQAKFWFPALLIVAICAAKDAIGAALPPGLKKPLDTLEVLENKLSGLVAAGAVVPFAMSTLSKLLLDSPAHAGVGAGVLPSGLAMMPVFGMSWAPVLDVLTVPFGVAVFLVVWMASHAINVLILLSPWGAIDAGLKAARTGLLGLVTLTATINPAIGALLSLVVIVVAYFVAGWAFRLTIFGSIFCWDFFTGRSGRFSVPAGENRMFAGAAWRAVPIRTYGRLDRREDGTLEFVYRPWLVLSPRTAPVEIPPAQIAVGRGLFVSNLNAADRGTLFLLPPRYRGHEEAVARQYQLGRGVEPAGLRKAWSSLKELVGGRAAPASPEPAAPARL